MVQCLPKKNSIHSVRNFYLTDNYVAGKNYTGCLCINNT